MKQWFSSHIAFAGTVPWMAIAVLILAGVGAFRVYADNPSAGGIEAFLNFPQDGTITVRGTAGDDEIAIGFDYVEIGAIQAGDPNADPPVEDIPSERTRIIQVWDLLNDEPLFEAPLSIPDQDTLDALTDVELVIVRAGDGNDFIDARLDTGDGAVPTELYGEDGDDLIYGSGEDDFINGGNGYDVVNGGDGDDIVTGGGGNDIVCGDKGKDQLYGGGGFDVVDYSTDAGQGAVRVDLDANTGTDGWGDTDTYPDGFPAVRGKGTDDTLSGNKQGGSTILGGPGNDTIVAYGGNRGGNIIFGDGGNDNITIASSPESASNFIFGGLGSDRINDPEIAAFASDGADTICGDGEESPPWDNFTEMVEPINPLTDTDPTDPTLPRYLPPHTIPDFGGNDVIYGGKGGDTIYGGGGSDVIYGCGGLSDVSGVTNDADLIFGDFVIDSNDPTAPAYLNGGNDTIYGGPGDDTIQGGAGNDTIYGGDGNDWMMGNLGNDTFFGGEADPLITGGGQLDQDYGDTVDYRFAAGDPTSGMGVYVDLGASMTTGMAMNDGDIDPATMAPGIDRILGVENLVGSDFNDILIGTNTAGTNDQKSGNMLPAPDSRLTTDPSYPFLYGYDNIIIGRAGNDLIIGRGGDDALFGDDLEANPLLPNSPDGDDVIYGDNANQGEEGGNDVLWGGGGNDELHGEGGDDILIGGVAALLPGAPPVMGKNKIYGGAGKDTILYGSAVIGTRSFSLSTDRGVPLTIDLSGTGDGTATGDLTVPPDGVNEINDIIGICDNYQPVYFPPGTPSIANPLIDCTNPSIDHFARSEVIYGGRGNDTITGYKSYSTEIHGGAGNDTITGGDVDDVLKGDAGDDTIEGGMGDDDLDGGTLSETAGDTVSYQHYVPSVPPAAGAPTPGVVVNLAKLSRQNTMVAGWDILTGFENITGTDYDDQLLGDNAPNVLKGGAGNDVLIGRGDVDPKLQGVTVVKKDTLDGGDGVDTVDYRLGDPAIAGATDPISKGILDGEGGSDDLVNVENILLNKATSGLKLWFNGKEYDVFQPMPLIVDAGADVTIAPKDDPEHVYAGADEIPDINKVVLQGGATGGFEAFYKYVWDTVPPIYIAPGRVCDCDTDCICNIDIPGLYLTPPLVQPAVPPVCAERFCPRTISQPTASPNKTTTYRLTVKYYDVALGWISSSDTVTVTVADTLVVDAGPDKNVSLGKGVQLTGTVKGGKPAYIYNWTPADTLTGADTLSPIATPASVGTFEYTFTVTDSSGQVARDTVTVSVVRSPSVRISKTVSVLAGQSVPLAVTVSDGTPPYSFAWAPVTGLSLTDAPDPEASPDKTTSYTVTVTDANGQQASDSVTVNVISDNGSVPVTEPLVVNAGPDVKVDQGTGVQLNSVVSGGSSPYVYEWAPIEGLSAADHPNPVATPQETTTYVLTVMDSAGQRASDDVLVTVVPATGMDNGTGTGDTGNGTSDDGSGSTGTVTTNPNDGTDLQTDDTGNGQTTDPNPDPDDTINDSDNNSEVNDTNNNYQVNDTNQDTVTNDGGNNEQSAQSGDEQNLQAEKVTPFALCGSGMGLAFTLTNVLLLGLLRRKRHG